MRDCVNKAVRAKGARTLQEPAQAHAATSRISTLRVRDQVEGIESMANSKQPTRPKPGAPPLAVGLDSSSLGVPIE